MPWWLLVFLIGVIALLLREVALWVGQRSGRVLDLTPHGERLQRRVTGLRLLASLALLLAVGQRSAYRLGWGDQAIDVMTSLFLAAAVVLILAAWRLRKKYGDSG